MGMLAICGTAKARVAKYFCVGKIYLYLFHLFIILLMKHRLHAYQVLALGRQTV